MKDFTWIKLGLFALLFTVVQIGYGQVTIINETLRSGSIPAGWSQTSVSFSTSAGGYALFSSLGSELETTAFDGSSYSEITVELSVAKFGSGGNGPITVEYSLNGGTTWLNGGDSGTPTSSTYVNNTVTITSVSATMAVRFVRVGSLSQKRLRDVVIQGVALASEPTNHPTSFLVGTGTPSSSVIDLLWDDATGAQLPDGYVIKANTTGTFADPVDGTDPAEDTDLSDGSALVKVAYGVESYSFTGLNESTQYYFKIWPYTNTGANIDFKTDGTPGEDNATTEAACGISALGTESYSCDSNTTGADNDFVTVSVDYSGVDASAVLTITSGGGSESNTGDDPTSVANGTISFAAIEGDAWSVAITGGNCNLSANGTVPSMECDPPPTIAINELLADPDSDVNGDGATDGSEDEFIELYNSGVSSVDISGWTVEDAVTTRHTFPPGTTIPPNEGIVVFGGGSPVGIPSLVQTASGGLLGFNNGGDNIELRDDMGALIDSYSYGSSSNDVSAARNPDFSGSFVLHTAIAGNPVNYSPGRFNVTNNAFPVELSFIEGKLVSGEVIVSWQTATEQNNSHFLIERSTDGRTFENIGRVEGKGNSAQEVDYNYVDTKPAQGLNYYRLQQFDFDGTNAYYGPIAIRFGEGETKGPRIWPVPTSGLLQLELPNSDDTWELTVYDLNGQLLQSQKLESKSLNTTFDLGVLPAGTYLLQWKNGQQLGQQRVVKL